MTTLSRMIANGRPTFSWVVWAKRWLPVVSNDRITLGVPSCESKSCRALAIMSPVMMARRSTAIRPPSAVGQDLAADRRPSRLQLLGRHVLVDHLELEPGGAADQRLERLRVLQAGNLDDDTVAALAKDGRPRACRAR